VKSSDASAEVYAIGIYHLTQRWKKCVNNENLNFVEDASMIYANLIIIAIIVSEENRRHYFRTTNTTNFIPENTFFGFDYFCIVGFTLQVVGRFLMWFTQSLCSILCMAMWLQMTKIAQHKMYTPLRFANLTF
jgi:hypothetical protein